jgi:hypothetical protein
MVIVPDHCLPGFGINVREGHRSLSRSGGAGPLMRHSPEPSGFRV